jgi:GAF domain-containing protein/HAMP domain-containing protein
MRWWQRRGLRFKLALAIILTMFLILGGAIFGISQYIRAQLWQREVQAAENLNAISAILLEDAMMSGRKDHIHEALVKLGQSARGRIDSIAVYDDQAVLTSFASAFPGGRTIQRESLEEDVRAPTCWGCHQLPQGERPAMTVVSLEGQDVMRNVVPLYNEPRCQTCHGTGKEVLGDSILDLRLDRYQQASTAVTLALAGGVALAVVLVVFALYLLLRGIVVSPLGELVAVTRAVTQGDLERQVKVRSGDEVGQVGAAFNNMTAQLREFIGSLEQRVAERTRDLEQRSAYLEASADVSRAATSILDAERLIQQAVNLIKDRFDLYFVGLFLVDESNEWAVLKAGTGEAGRAMLARDHRLAVGKGMIGWSIANARARVALDVGDDAVHFDNPHLRFTRSEAALPLRSRGRVLGALTVQSSEESAFDQDTIITLQTMADQVAVALDNAAMFAQSQMALEAERRAYGESSREAWAQMFRTRPDLGYLCNPQGIHVVESQWRPAMVQASQSGQTVQDEGPTVAIPITIRDHIAGVVRLRKPDDAGEWTAEEIGLMETLAEQLGVALEEARLFGESQRRAAREQMMSEVSARIRETLDVETVLKTAAQELRQSLRLPEVTIRLGTPPRSTDTGGNGRPEEVASPSDDEERAV